MKIVVSQGTQINHEGKVYAAGESLEAPGPVASKWVQAGIAREVTKKK